jgi:hypothetical protein
MHTIFEYLLSHLFNSTVIALFDTYVIQFT